MSDLPRPSASLLWLLAFALAALNLRAPIVVIGPVLEPIMASLDIGAGAASLLTTGMILCFGLLSPLAPTLSARLGLDRAIALALVAVAIGSLLRGIEAFPVMLLGTLFAGLGIAFGNVFMPSLVKRDRADRLGQTMGLYTVVMGIGATLAAGTAVPLLQASGHWSTPVRLWAGLAVVAAICWLWLAFRRAVAPQTGGPVRMTALFRSPVAWTLTIFMGMQSLSFYTLQTWMPSVAISSGVSSTMAGNMVSLLNLVSIPASYVIARVAARMHRHSLLVLGMCGLIAIGLAGLLLAPTRLPALWAVLLGAGQGGCFSFALTMIVLRTRESQHAAMLSGMSQSVGYLLAASGPLLFGALKAMTGGWAASMGLLMVLLGVQAVAGFLIGRPRMVTLARR
ncbi:CynX/NimT family MFS transporter [Kushneria marisflavi]|uniref:MFS transporter n=1 Tax=Kushneria marisflavi TaxID=157779 RepID=A0A240UMW6_9GAMM|nr:MFS transporter [Kushneria marisflavi]ART62831.1 MFS transporter [Kushneria marisflavi]RKD84962.1 CP family cyanate transporter-like MFS transporter [Kushneria marisflavi]